MAITELPTPPSRQDPANFASRGDALMGALPQFVEEANSLAAAMNLNSTTDSSDTSNSIGVGTKTFAVSSGKSFQPGMYLIFADSAAPSTNSMLGQVTSYSGTSLVVFVKSISGSGTKSSWVISQSAPGGASLDIFGKVVEVANEADHALEADHSDTSTLADVATVANAAPGATQFSHRNKIINGDFRVNQRAYVSAAAVGSVLYGHDRWKMAASGDTYTFSTTANKTTVTIPAGKVLQQVVEGLNLQTGTYTLSWEGTAQGKIGAGAYAASGVTGAITGGTDATIEFGPGTVANVQLELGSKATPFEFRSYGEELSLCRRYLPAFRGDKLCWLGKAKDAFNTLAVISLPVAARVAPTGVTISNVAHFAVDNPAASTSTAISGISLVNANVDTISVQMTNVANNGNAAGGAIQFFSNSASAYILFTGCEL